MPTNRKAPVPATKPKAHRIARSDSKKPRDVPAPVSLEFDAVLHHEEIAEVAYYNWQERAGAPGSPEEDWLQAESHVRAKYTR